MLIKLIFFLFIFKLYEIVVNVYCVQKLKYKYCKTGKNLTDTGWHKIVFFFFNFFYITTDHLSEHPVHWYLCKMVPFLKDLKPIFLNIFEKILQKWNPHTLFTLFWYQTHHMWNFTFLHFVLKILNKNLMNSKNHFN